jgi:hypothetical protein
MYYIQTKKNLGANHVVFLITRAYINVCTIYKINIYVCRFCSRIIILYCGLRSSYPMWAIVPCVLVDCGRVEWREYFAWPCMPSGLLSFPRVGVPCGWVACGHMGG